MNKEHIQEYLEFGLGILNRTGPFILQKIQEGFDIEMKLDKTVVTGIDRETENLVKREILNRYPTHGVFGEEYGSVNEDSDIRWLIDPIDGTEAFVKGSKDYGTLLALQHERGTVLGLIDLPSHGLRYYAPKGGGSFRDGHRLMIQDLDTSKLEVEGVAVCRRAQFERHGALKVYEKLLENVKSAKEISDCYGHTRALEGEVGAMIDYNLSIWDIEATRILIEEAGGKFVIQDEKKKPDGSSCYGIIFGKTKLVDLLCDLLSSK